MFEASNGDDASHNASEPKSASLDKVRVATLPEVLKPTTISEATGIATVGLSGV